MANYVAPVSGLWADNSSNVFGANRSGGAREHAGNDLHAPAGSPAVAAIGGTVAYVGQNQGYLWNAVVLGDDGNAFRYATHGPIAVRPGDRVEQGQPIGTIAGIAGGSPHLHFEVIPNTSPAYAETVRNFQAGKVSPKTGGFVSTKWSRGGRPVTADPAKFFGVAPGAKIAAGQALGDPAAASVAASDPLNDPFGVAAMQREMTGDPAVAKLQTYLAKNGFNPGPVDGVMGDSTLSALNTYNATVDPEGDALARVMLAEARGEGPEGMAAVAWVAKNRTMDPSGRWPQDIAAVVGQPRQFASPDSSPDPQAYADAFRLATEVRSAPPESDPTGGAVYFANPDTSNPRALAQIQASGTLTAKIGNHEFYGAAPAGPMTAYADQLNAATPAAQAATALATGAEPPSAALASALDVMGAGEPGGGYDLSNAPAEAGRVPNPRADPRDAIASAPVGPDWTMSDRSRDAVAPGDMPDPRANPRRETMAALLDDSADTAPSAGRYVVQPGDNPWRIAQQVLGANASGPEIDAKAKEIVSLNAIANPRNIKPGTVLSVPGMVSEDAGVPTPRTRADGLQAQANAAFDPLPASAPATGRGPGFRGEPASAPPATGRGPDMRGDAPDPIRTTLDAIGPGLDAEADYLALKGRARENDFNRNQFNRQLGGARPNASPPSILPDFAEGDPGTVLPPRPAPGMGPDMRGVVPPGHDFSISDAGPQLTIPTSYTPFTPVTHLRSVDGATTGEYMQALPPPAPKPPWQPNFNPLPGPGVIEDLPAAAAARGIGQPADANSYADALDAIDGEYGGESPDVAAAMPYAEPATAQNAAAIDWSTAPPADLGLSDQPAAEPTSYTPFTPWEPHQPTPVVSPGRHVVTLPANPATAANWMMDDSRQHPSASPASGTIKDPTALQALADALDAPDTLPGSYDVMGTEPPADVIQPGHPIILPSATIAGSAPAANRNPVITAPRAAPGGTTSTATQPGAGAPAVGAGTGAASGGGLLSGPLTAGLINASVTPANFNSGQGGALYDYATGTDSGTGQQVTRWQDSDGRIHTVYIGADPNWGPTQTTSGGSGLFGLGRPASSPASLY